MKFVHWGLRWGFILSLLFISTLSVRDASAAQLGAYVSNSGIGCNEEANLQAFENWLGRPVGSMLALSYGVQTYWADFYNEFGGPSGYYGGMGTPGWLHACNPNRNVEWAIPLTQWGTPLSQVAAGQYDYYFAHAAAAIAAYQPYAIIRPGWEMNGSWFPWGAGVSGSAADFVAAFQHVVGIFRAASPNFRIDWCVAMSSPGEPPTTNFWPGPQYVDIVGMDFYDAWNPGYPLTPANEQQGWNDYQNIAYGLNWQVSFAAANQKPLSFPEWGLGVGDNPLFINYMAAWIATHNVAYADYWDVNAGFTSELYPTTGLSQSAGAFRNDFSQ